MTITNIQAALSAFLAAGLLASVGAAPSEPDQAAAAQGKPAPHASVRAVADVERVSPGQTFHFAVIFDIKPGWHIYWKNPGEGAAPPEIELRGPEGFAVGSILWPRPRVQPSVVGDQFVYEQQVALFVTVTAPMTLNDGRAMFSADVNWAVCDEKICHLESSRTIVNIKTASEAGASAPSADPAVATFWKRLPTPIDKVDGARISFDGKTLTIEAPAQGRTSASIISDCSPGVKLGKAKFVIEGDRVTATVPVEIKPNNSLDQPMSVGGLLALGTKSDDPCIEFSLPVKNP